MEKRVYIEEFVFDHYNKTDPIGLSKVVKLYKEYKKQWKLDNKKVTKKGWNMKCFQKLDRLFLLSLVCCYDEYVQEVCDREDGSIPVCLSEYYNNEYQELERAWDEKGIYRTKWCSLVK